MRDYIESARWAHWMDLNDMVDTKESDAMWAELDVLEAAAEIEPPDAIYVGKRVTVYDRDFAWWMANDERVAIQGTVVDIFDGLNIKIRLDLGYTQIYSVRDIILEAK